MTGYLTPNINPTTRYSRRLRLPDDLQFIANVSGALLELANPANWTAYGSVSPDDAAKTAMQMIEEYWNSNMIGQIVAYATVDPPDGTLPCDGSVYDGVDYPELFIRIDPAFYGSGATFHTPDLRGKVLLGAGVAGALTYDVGDVGGEVEHTLIVSETPAHTHTDTGHVHSTGNSATAVAVAPGELPVLVPNPIPTVTGSASANLTDTGGDGAHNNMQPWMAIKYAIYYE